MYSAVCLDAPGDADLLGETLGDYELVDVLGEGGMSVVYAGRHTRDRRRFAAVKVQRPETPLEFFGGEATLLGAMRDPRVLRLLDAGTVPGTERRYLVTELARGVPLCDYLDDLIAPPMHQIVELMACVADAVEAVHRCRIVHADLSPANIHVDDGPAGTQIQLIDFGAGRHLDHGGDERAIIQGTPDYVAPEQIMGQAPVPQTDVYALGILLFEALTGAVPFHGLDLRSVLEQHLLADVPRLEVASAVGADALNRVLSGALAKAAGDRYPDAGVMAAELRACARLLDGECVPADASWTVRAGRARGSRPPLTSAA